MKTSNEAEHGIEGLIEEGEAFRRLSANLTAGAPSRARRARVFHTGMSVAFLVTAFAGFAPTYYLKGVTHAPPLPLLAHVHGLVFTSWLLLLFVQTALVAAHRVGVHRRLGIAGAILATVMVPLGFETAVAAARRGLTTPGMGPLDLLIFPLGSLVMFTFFIGAALWKRRQPEIHRRLVLLATVSIITPAIARLPFVGMRPVVGLALSAMFVVAAILHDWKTRGRPHSIYLWGIVVILLSGPVRFGLGHTEAWHSFAHLLVD